MKTTWMILAFLFICLVQIDLKAQCYCYFIMERYDTQSGNITLWVSNVVDVEYPYDDFKRRLDYLFPGWVKADLKVITEGLTDGIKFCGSAGYRSATESRAGVYVFLALLKGEDVKIRDFNF